MNENLKNKIKQFVKTKMSNKRYNHCLCVSLEAKSLAKHYGEDTEKAEIAGLLHDVTKEFSKEEHLEIMSKNKLDLSKIERNTPKLWHAITAYLKRCTLPHNWKRMYDKIRKNNFFSRFCI